MGFCCLVKGVKRFTLKWMCTYARAFSLLLAFIFFLLAWPGVKGDDANSLKVRAWTWRVKQMKKRKTEFIKHTQRHRTRDDDVKRRWKPFSLCILPHSPWHARWKSIYDVDRHSFFQSISDYNRRSMAYSKRFHCVFSSSFFSMRVHRRRVVCGSSSLATFWAKQTWKHTERNHARIVWSLGLLLYRCRIILNCTLNASADERIAFHVKISFALFFFNFFFIWDDSHLNVSTEKEHTHTKSVPWSEWYACVGCRSRRCCRGVAIRVDFHNEMCEMVFELELWVSFSLWMYAVLWLNYHHI